MFNNLIIVLLFNNLLFLILYQNIKYIIIYILFIVSGFYIYFNKNNFFLSKKKKELLLMESKKNEFLDGPNFLSPDKYPEAKKILVENKHIILSELKNILSNNILWSVWDESNYKPIKNNFTDMSTISILNRLNKIQKLPDKHNKLWTLYGLKLYKKNIDKNIKNAPKTFKIINSIPNVLNAGFSCLAQNTSTNVHQETTDKGFDRIHLPLIIPDGDCAIQIQDDIRKWSDCDSILVFDDRRFHNAWNYTKYPRFVLIVDVEKKN